MVACYNEPLTVHAQHRVEYSFPHDHARLQHGCASSSQRAAHVRASLSLLALVHNVPLTFALASACLL